MGRIVVDEERCKGCELCAPVCPSELIVSAPHFNRQGYHPATMTDTPKKKCSGCALCARACPDVAILVYR